MNRLLNRPGYHETIRYAVLGALFGAAFLQLALEEPRRVVALFGSCPID